MPQLVRLYITQVAIGFALAAVFVALLLALDVGGLRRLILGTSGGWLGGVMLWVFNGIVFAGVQFGIAVMRMAEGQESEPPGGRRPPAPSPHLPRVPLRVSLRVPVARAEARRRAPPRG